MHPRLSCVLPRRRGWGSSACVCIKPFPRDVQDSHKQVSDVIVNVKSRDSITPACPSSSELTRCLDGWLKLSRGEGGTW